MKQITITLTFEADKLPLDEFANFLVFISKDIERIEQEVKKKFPQYEVKPTGMKVDDIGDKK